MAFQDYFIKQLIELEQSSHVDEFHQQFDAIRTLAEYTKPGILKEYFTSLSVYGLETDVQDYVDGFLHVIVINVFTWLPCLSMVINAVLIRIQQK